MPHALAIAAALSAGPAWLALVLALDRRHARAAAREADRAETAARLLLAA